MIGTRGSTLILRRASRRGVAIVALAIAVAAALLAGGDAFAQAPAPAAIGGQVVQRTSGAAVPEGLEVTLRTVDQFDNPVDERSQAVDAEGRFRFEDLATGDGYRYRLSVTYGNLRRTVKVEDALNPEDILLYIFETTDSLDAIKVKAHSIVVPRVDRQSRLMGVLELIELTNDGDRTFAADINKPGFTGRDMLHFSLPDGYQKLTIDTDLPTGSQVKVAGGFAMTNVVPPGNFSILATYGVNYDGDTFEFDKTLPFGADQFRLLLAEGIASVSGAGLEPAGSVTEASTTYEIYTGTGYLPGETVRVRLEGLPTPTLRQRLSNLISSSAYTTIGIPVLAAAAMAALLSYVFFFRKRDDEEPEEPLSPDERREIVAEIAELDDEFEAGKIEESEYRQDRAELAALLAAENDDAPPLAASPDPGSEPHPPAAPDETRNRPAAEVDDEPPTSTPRDAHDARRGESGPSSRGADAASDGGPEAKPPPADA